MNYVKMKDISSAGRSDLSASKIKNSKKEIKDILNKYQIKLNLNLDELTSPEKFLMALKGLTQTTTGAAMLNAIGRLLTANPKSEFVDKIENLKISDKTGPNFGSQTGLSDDGTTLEINLSFDEIEKNKDLYIVTDFSGQKRFICVNQPSPVILGHELGHVIQMLSLKTSNINVALEEKWSTTIMNSLGSAVTDEVCKVLENNAEIFKSAGITDPIQLLVYIHKMSLNEGEIGPMMKKEKLLVEFELTSEQKNNLKNIYEACLFALNTWNDGTYAELFNILPKQNGDAIPAQWSDGQLLKEIELLRNLSSDVSTVASYYEIDNLGAAMAEKLDAENTYDALNKDTILPVRFGHSSKAVKDFMNFNEQTKKYTWTFIGSLLGAFGVSDEQLPMIFR